MCADSPSRLRRKSNTVKSTRGCTPLAPIPDEETSAGCFAALLIATERLSSDVFLFLLWHS